MSTINLDINQCSKNEFPIELIITGKQIYRGFIKLAKTTGGAIILFPLLIAFIVVIPITYFLMAILFTYYSIRIKFFFNRIMNSTVDKSNYKDMYDIFLRTKEVLPIIENFNSSGKHKIALYPITLFLNSFYRQALKANKYLEMQLFEVYNSKTISKKAVDSFKKQLNKIDHDWDDDELWKDFQIEHHHN